MLELRLRLAATLLDHGLPKHSNTVGRSHLGTLVTPTLFWRPHRAVDVEAGAIVRLPMSLDFEEDLGALPVLTLTARPIAALDLAVRLGSIGPLHGFHPALVHENRLAYGRDVAEAYDRPLAIGGKRAIEGDPRLPMEHGVQVNLQTRWLSADAFLDWQLLETEAHREKFAVGVLITGGIRRLTLSGQLYLDHYGGERYTASDPVRRAGLDPTRQDLALAAILRGRPLDLPPIAIDLVASAIGARPTLAGTFRGGLEIGADALLFDAITLGWRWWRVLDGTAGDLSEAGDPTFRQRETQRVSIALHQILGPLELTSRVDVVLPNDVDAVQYEVSTLALLHWEWPIPLSPEPCFE